MNCTLRLAIALSAMSLVSSAQAGTRYTEQLLPTLGGNYSRALGVNEVGQVVGVASTPDGVFHATVWTNGVPQQVGGDNTYGYGINDLGVAVGYGANQHATLWSGGTATDLGTLYGASYSVAFSVNNAGSVVGQTQTIDGQFFPTLWPPAGPGQQVAGQFGYAVAINQAGDIAFTTEPFPEQAALWAGGALTLLPNPVGSSWSAARGMNDLDQVVGFSGGPTYGQRPTLWSNGVAFDLGPEFMQAVDINNSGQIVGWDTHIGYVYDNGSWSALGSLLVGPVHLGIIDATGINDSGQIVGTTKFRDGNGLQYRGVILSPISMVPEPETWATMVLGFGGVGAYMRSRRRRAPGAEVPNQTPRLQPVV